MITTNFDTAKFNSIMKNATEYSYGFLEGVQDGRAAFNVQLGEIAEQLLKKYIDSKAKMNPESLHHVYEWNRVGDPSARLFELQSKASATIITITGNFLPSNSVSENSDTPFVDKANIMENQIAIVVEPKDADVLSFESGGQQVFTTNSIYIENPGGDGVSGSFGRVVEEFFDTYFTVAILTKSGLLEKLQTANEFTNYFSAGANGGGAATGRSAGSKYMRITGVDVE